MPEPTYPPAMTDRRPASTALRVVGAVVVAVVIWIGIAVVGAVVLALVGAETTTTAGLVSLAGLIFAVWWLARQIRKIRGRE